jgi:bifunctional DNase/RNase
MSAEGKAAGTLSNALSSSDAKLLALKPAGASVERHRLIGLIEALVRDLEARLAEVRFRLDPGMVLTADLQLESGLRSVTVSADVADAVVLALRAMAPMHISEPDLRWIRSLQEPSPVYQSEFEPGTPISAFIESLSLDDLRGPGGDGF